MLSAPARTAGTPRRRPGAPPKFFLSAQEEKTYTIEQMGRAGFDPEFAAQASDVDRELVGLEGGGLDQSGEDADAIARLREVHPLGEEAAGCHAKGR